MLITFYANKGPNIMMLGDVGKRCLVMMGHSMNIPGAILAKDVQTALDRLELALSATNKDASLTNVTQVDEGDESSQEIDLKKRAWPLIDLLKLSVKNNSDLMWN